MRHPLGARADALKNHRTVANRSALAYCLRLFFAGELSDQINKREGSDQVTHGVPLADRFVSRLEISHALTTLKDERADLAILLHDVYERNRSRRFIAQTQHLSIHTVSERVDEALNRMIDTIWFDPQE